MDDDVRRKLREDLTLSVEDAGRVFGLSKNPAYHACRAGLIPCIRFGRKFIIPTSGVRRMLGISETEK